MKTLITVLFSIISFVSLAQAQSGFPTTITNQNAPTPDLRERIIREGEAWAVSLYSPAFVWNGTTSGGGQSIGNITGTTPTKAFYVTGITISSSRPIVVQLNRSLNNGSLLNTRHVVNGTVTINSEFLVMPWETPSLNCINVIDSSPTSVTTAIAASFEGYRVFPDFHYSAKQPGYYIGDSKLNGSGLANAEKSVLAQLSSYLNTTIVPGKTTASDVRFTGTAISGSTSSDHELRRKRGQYNLDFSPSLIVIDLGTNDAIGNAPAATYTANVIALINQFRSQSNTANSIILVNSILPLSNTTSEANAVALRAALQTALAARTTDTRTYLVTGTGTLWNPVTGAAANQTDGIHPNDTGNTVWYTAIRDFIIANSILAQLI